MRYALAVFVAVSLLGCVHASAISGRASDTPPFKKASNTVPSADEISHFVVGSEAVEEFRVGYWQAAEHKAFASSEDGAWGWSAGMSRAQRVRDLAWSTCQGHVAPNGRPCRIVNIDGAWQP